MQILTHSYSRVVMEALLLMHKHKRISVYVTEARPNSLGSVPSLSCTGTPDLVSLDKRRATL